MIFQKLPIFRFCVLALACGAGMLSCAPNMSVEVGPFAVAVPAGEGVITPAMFVQMLDLSFGTAAEQPFCEIPTEEEAEAGVRMVGAIDVGRFVRLSRIELFQIVIVAHEGDFSFARRVELRYVPAPNGGEAPDPIVLGRRRGRRGVWSHDRAAAA
jgi:hypothetical protein